MPGKSLASFGRTASILLLAEEGDGDTAASTNDALLNMASSPPTNPGFDALLYTGRHSGGSNVAMLDGHVQWVPFSRLITARLPTGGRADQCN